MPRKPAVVVDSETGRVSIRPDIYRVTIETIEPILATASSDPELYTKFILKTLREQKGELAGSDELETLETVDPQQAVTVFHRLDGQPIFYDYMIRGFLKEAWGSLFKDAAYRHKIDRLVFVTPRRIPIEKDGLVIETFERPMRVQTPQGPRQCLAKSEMIAPPARLHFAVTVLPLGRDIFTADKLRAAFEVYGPNYGLGQWRSGGFGRFRLVSFETVEPPEE
jgi:hypothetical protein